MVSAIHAIGKITLDGYLNEDEWSRAQSIDALTMVEPTTGNPASLGTTVKIVMDKRDIYLGII